METLFSLAVCIRAHPWLKYLTYALGMNRDSRRIPNAVALLRAGVLLNDSITCHIDSDK